MTLNPLSPRDRRVVHIALKNERGIIYTVGYMCDNPKEVNRHALKLNDDGLVVNEAGKLVAVVHQADRCQEPRGWKKS